MNDEIVAGGPATVQTCFALYKFHKQQRKQWTGSMERAMSRVCDEIGTLSIAALDRRLCEQLIEKRRGLGLSKDTVRIEMAYLRAAVRYAASMNRIPAAPFIVVPCGGEARERWLTQSEVSRLIEGATELHVKLFVILAVTTAARPSHILGLTWDRVDPEHLIINFRDPTQGGNNKRRPRVPINETCLEHLKVAHELRRTEYVIEFRGQGGFANIKKGVAAAALRASLAGVSPYVLRHTAGVWMAKAGIPMQEIAAYMGHTNMATTMKHYAHFHPSFLRGAAGALEIKQIGPKGRGSDSDQRRERGENRVPKTDDAWKI